MNILIYIFLLLNVIKKGFFYNKDIYKKFGYFERVYL